MKKVNKYFSHKKSIWLITFVDLTTIVLVLFILIYSFSVLDAKKMGAVVDSFNQQGLFQADQEKKGTVIDRQTEQKLMELLKNEEKIKQILTFVEQFSQEHHIQIDTVHTPGGIELVLPETMLFESGKADIIELAQDFLNRMAPLLNAIPNEIKVEGHTDNVPISSIQFPTNWELSTARATRVIRYLTEKHGLEPKRFAAGGFGEYRPLFTNDTAEGRNKNRRVVILISNDIQVSS